MKLRCFIISGLVAITVLGCSVNPNTRVPASLVSIKVPVLQGRVDFETHFQGFTGAFVLHDLTNDGYIRYNPEQCSERLLPASTFKIMSSLIGLETGVIPDENYVIEWDGTKHDISSWNQDHTLKTAIQNSVVWYYQELARRVGRERMQHYVDTAGYGNQAITGPIEAFWLDGTLKISADEQVEFLKRLYQSDLAFSGRSTKIVKEILVLETTDTYRLSGKTGSGQADNVYIGWFVGFMEEENSVFVFATNIKGADSAAKGLKAKEITLSILQELELLP